MPSFPRSTEVTVQVRPARRRVEMREFTRWHHLAGVPHARPAGHNLLQVSDAGILSTGHLSSYALSVQNTASGASHVPTVLAARTAALVAAADGHPIGGLSAGPAFFLCAQLVVLGHWLPA
ncbi:hypothetical protein OH799_11830 [Nocardia sp. NBC_00881]|uniref:hypothetical protein n=1 Tax=Nocardia sp. NBC_00881 TaxID=2975995 RepID=UPI003865303E|nr:hypothetical protein OH799_11830 [Nocardia sp. NBC_00881]